MGAHESVVDDAGVVRIGTVLFALIRPTPGHELDFNHWYERDHYYTTGTAAPGVFSAGRFVQPESGWHLALYFVLPGFDAARIALRDGTGGIGLRPRVGCSPSASTSTPGSTTWSRPGSGRTGCRWRSRSIIGTRRCTWR